MELFFDTETTGLPLFKEEPTHPNQPDVIQLGAILSDAEHIYTQLSCVIDPSDLNPEWKMHPKAAEAHGISDEIIRTTGLRSEETLNVFINMVERADLIVCHNVSFDKKLIMIALHRLDRVDHYNFFRNGAFYCTMNNSTNLCKLPGKFGYKWPKLMELYQFLFNETFEGAHDALEDVRATRRCFYEMQRRGLV
jgi:DNA polymerase III epsilon subunit-like protein